ncbi:MAG: hypothetical protein DRN57_01385 [Thermoplasmata archaeon]|nr:MAG: hypothetical protein DRN57_01385 [Thermoplasmata archaeon]
MNFKIINILIIMMLISIISGCISSSDDESYHELYYEIHIEYAGNGEVYLPIPYDYPNEGDLEPSYESKIISDLKLTKGNGHFKLINTEKGIALKLNFTDEVTLTAKKRFTDINELDYNDYFFDGLSLKNNETSGYYYFYSDQDDVKINSFICYFDRVGSRDSHMAEWKITNKTLQKGWNSLEIN